MDKNNQGKLKSKRDNALAILKIWEEELKMNNQISEAISKEKNESKKSMASNVRTG